MATVFSTALFLIDIISYNTTVDSLKRSLANGRYKIIARVGSGGMATVYRAYDTHNDRDVAIKVLLDDLTGEQSFLRRFQRESDMMRDLDHPHILRAYDYGRDDDAVYLVMSYYGGGTLKERIVKGRGVESLTQIADYLDQIAAGLGYAHARGIVHRDIKPSNILVHHADDHLVISDFGIAKAIGPLAASRSGTGNIMGTPRYMAPEQFLDRVDRRSDIYALGVMLYEMLTGRAPFTGESLGFQHMRDTPPPLAEAAPERPLNPAIEAVVMKALAKHPDDRYQSAEEMAQAFRAAIGQQPDAQPPRATPAPGLPLDARSSSFVGLSTPADRLRAANFQFNPPNEAETKPKPHDYANFRQVGAVSYAHEGYGFVSAEQPTTRNAIPPAAPPRDITPLPAPKRSRRATLVVIVAAVLLTVGIITGLIYLLTNSDLRDGVPGAAGGNIGNRPTSTRVSTTAPASLPPTDVPTAKPGVSVPPNVLPSNPVRVAFVTNQRSASNDTTGLSVYYPATKNRQDVLLPGAATDPIALYANPAWSSDGKTLYYHRFLNPGPFFLYFATLNTSVTENPVAALRTRPAAYPAMSRNGNRLAYIVPSGQPNANAIFVGDATAPAFPDSPIVAAGSREVSGLAWSPNARMLTYAQQDGNGITQIFVVDTDASPPQPTQLTNFPTKDEQARFPTWSPDGKKIIFGTSTSDSIPIKIYTMDTNGKNQAPLTNPDTHGHAGRPVWSCDSDSSQRVYFSTDLDNGEKSNTAQRYRSQIYSIRPDGADIHPLFADDGLNDYNPIVWTSLTC